MNAQRMPNGPYLQVSRRIGAHRRLAGWLRRRRQSIGDKLVDVRPLALVGRDEEYEGVHDGLQ